MTSSYVTRWWGRVRRMEEELNAGDNLEVLANLCQLRISRSRSRVCRLPFTCCHDVTPMSVAAAATNTSQLPQKFEDSAKHGPQDTSRMGPLYTDGCSCLLRLNSSRNAAVAPCWLKVIHSLRV